ncbi:MAG: ATP-binding cassette domain-containing protein [Eubacteriales bacterium]
MNVIQRTMQENAHRRAQRQEDLSRRHRRYALRGTDLQIASGDICSIIGPSGSGKSTLLRAREN